MDLLNKRINFHIHTRYSFDSFLEPSYIVDFLYKNKFDIAIITDHDSIYGALEAQKYAQKKYGSDFMVIVGEEVKTDIGDIIGFPVIKEVKPSDYKTVISEFKEQGSMLCLPHPYKSHDLFLIHQDDFINQFDFIEVFNSRVNDKLNNYAMQLAVKYNKLKIIGNDAHVKEDLLNCSLIYKDDLKAPEFTTKKTNIRNIRKSQLINHLKKKEIIPLTKYFFLYISGL